MLYPINPPSCSPALDWAVQLQRDLIAKLCDPNTTRAMVTPQWVRALRANPQEIADWLEGFAGRKFEGVQVIDAMKYIANLNTDEKMAALNYFSNNHRFTDEFVLGSTVSPTVDVSIVGNPQIQSALKTILVAFYKNGLLYLDGFPIDGNGNPGQCTNRNVFVDAFKKDNNINVCPLCDGDLNGPEVDHWLPESKYPALSCHPKNLVPICHDCNSPANKHDKVPLTAGHAQPFEEWFHPYERTANGQMNLEIRDGRNVYFASDDPLIQKRFENLDWLINLAKRWSNIYQREKGLYIKTLRGQIARGKLRPEPDAVLEKIQEWKEGVEDRGIEDSYSIIKSKILEMISNPESADFKALLQEITNGNS
ncbi:MAG: hypothetical protein A4E58_01486 [Syntrophorhabdus sp. PtaB.Bin006]|nr:MAG: hypothetical protein A4E58_01486 [Syntrophorhabdus sp. PtaB.Bin006]